MSRIEVQLQRLPVIAEVVVRGLGLRASGVTHPSAIDVFEDAKPGVRAPESAEGEGRGLQFRGYVEIDGGTGESIGGCCCRRHGAPPGHVAQVLTYYTFHTFHRRRSSTPCIDALGAKLDAIHFCMMTQQHNDSIPTDVSRLLEAWRGGDVDARDRLMDRVYDELHRLAQRAMRSERQITLQPTALVNEAFMRLADAQVPWNDRAHFFAVAATTMRRILVDEARRRQADKRGGGEAPMVLDEALAADPSAVAFEPSQQLLALDDALQELAALDERKSRVLELRLFSGLTIDETAAVLDISHATVERDLKMARAWLSNALRPTSD